MTELWGLTTGQALLIVVIASTFIVCLLANLGLIFNGDDNETD